MLNTNFNVESEIGKVSIIDPTSDPRWDRFVENHPRGWLCHLSGWKKVLEHSFPHMKGYYLVLQNNRGIQAGLPVYLVKSYFRGNRIISIPYATISDPLISTQQEMRILLRAVKQLKKVLGVSHVELRTFKTSISSDEESIGKDNYYKIHCLPLNQDIKTIYRGFHHNIVRNLKKANKNNFKFKTANNETDLKAFYQLYFKTRKRLGLPPHPYKFIKNVWDEFSPTGKVSIVFTVYNDLPIAALMFFKFKKRISEEYSTSDANYWSLCPNHFLIWESIKKAQTEGFEIFDFGRTAPSNLGLMNFKTKWGAEIEDLPSYYHPKKLVEKNTVNEKSRMYDLVKGLCENIPDFALSVIGRFIYRHI